MSGDNVLSKHRKSMQNVVDKDELIDHLTKRFSNMKILNETCLVQAAYEEYVRQSRETEQTKEKAKFIRKERKERKKQILEDLINKRVDQLVNNSSLIKEKVNLHSAAETNGGDNQSQEESSKSPVVRIRSPKRILKSKIAEFKGDKSGNVTNKKSKDQNDDLLQIDREKYLKYKSICQKLIKSRYVKPRVIRAMRGQQARMLYDAPVEQLKRIDDLETSCDFLAKNLNLTWKEIEKDLKFLIHSNDCLDDYWLLNNARCTLPGSDYLDSDLIQCALAEYSLEPEVMKNTEDQYNQIFLKDLYRSWNDDQIYSLGLW